MYREADPDSSVALEISQLKKDIATLQNENAKLRRYLEERDVKIDELTEFGMENLKLRQRVAQLEYLLVCAKKGRSHE
jgi:hypothetical protein